MTTGLEIAVIGMAGKFPGARNLEEFWENLKNGRETIFTYTEEELRESGIGEQYLGNPNYIRAYGIVEDKAYFDAAFFGYSPREAETMDPLMRLFHESAWEALEDAGYEPITYNESIGIYAGSSDGFGWQVLKTLRSIRNPGEDTGQHITENPLLLSTRISHKLNLRGPSMTLFTACSTGLVAIHTASRALLTGECRMAIAGAGAILSSEKSGYMYQEGMIMSPDGHCRPFDAKARGTVYGDGIGVVVLKRLKHAAEEGDSIRVVIRASAINNDGTDKASYTAPGKQRIADVVRTVLKLSRTEPGDIGYIETHGTATPLGDAIEIAALKEAYNTEKKGYCAIGSHKSNIGHLDVAAGMAGFIKTVQALIHRQIPPTLHFETPNPTIDFVDSPFYVNAGLTTWEGERPLRAGVCAFGIGGTNAFLILEESPGGLGPGGELTVVPQPISPNRLIPLSARTDAALEKMKENLAAYLKKNPGVDLADVAYTLQVGRRVFSRRRVVVCGDRAEAVEALSTRKELKGREGEKDSLEDLYRAYADAKASNRPGEEKKALEAIGRAWEGGAAVEWQELYRGQLEPGQANQKPQRIPLPTYPFERQYYWINLRTLGLDLATLGEASAGRAAVEEKPGAGRWGVSKAVITGAGRSAGDPAKNQEQLYPRPQLSTQYRPPCDEIEKVIAGVWKRFFGIKDIGRDDNFFELGGDSLKAITVFTELHKQMETRIPISEIFRTPTIGGLAQYAREAGTSRYAAIEPVEEREYYPLSSVQRRIYLLQQVDLDSTGYNSPLVFELEGELDKGRLEQVFRDLVERHESFRTSFQWVEGETVQRIHKTVKFEIEYDRSLVNGQLSLVNCQCQGRGEVPSPFSSPSPLPSPSSPPIGVEKIIGNFIRPFDMTRAPLLRVGLIENPSQHLRAKSQELRANYILMVDMHHIVTDGSSTGIMAREFMALYSGQVFAPLRIRYKDYTQWQNSAKQREAIREQEAFWMGQLAGELPVLNLPADYARPTIQEFSGKTLVLFISGEETEALKKIAASEEATLFMILLALYNTWMAKMCRQEDIIVGIPIAGRNHADLQPVIGMLVNTLALRNYPAGTKTFRGFLREVKENTLAAFENQDYLFEDLVEKVTLAVHRDFSRNPVFDTMFSLMNFQSQYEAKPVIAIPGLTLAVRGHERGTSIFDLSLHGEETEQGISFILEYSIHLFKEETAVRLGEYLKRVIASVAAAPDREIGRVDILDAAEKKQLLEDFNGPALAAAPGKLIHELLDEVVEKQPDRTALVYEGQQITYGELNEKSTALAGQLALKGVKPGVIVGIMAERSLEMIIGLLAIIKAGGACMPIDLEYPGTRKIYMLRNAGIDLLLTDVEQDPPGFIPGEIQVLPLNAASSYRKPVGTVLIPGMKRTEADLLYVLYTSGTTGKPKGIMLEQRTILNLIRHQNRYTDLDFSRVLQYASIGFDVSFQEIFSTLLAGGLLVSIPGATVKNIFRLLKVIEKNQVITLLLSSSLLKFIFNDAEISARFPGSVRHIAAAGEQLVVTGRFRDYLQANRVHLHNHYGPAETHVITMLTMDPRQEIPALPCIGKPLANVSIYIVDMNRQLQPVGIAGEMLAGGVQVARGYLNSPELTQERFLFKFYRSYRSYRTYIMQPCNHATMQLAPHSHPSPFTFHHSPFTFHHSPFTFHHSPLYKTGDLARWRRDGSIEFLGRIDHQVKIRGYRIELGEIETHLLNHVAIKEAVVMDRKSPGYEYDKYLCAYIVPMGSADRAPNNVELKDYLAQRLPEYMIPSFFVTMERIPLNANGKVDRKMLPEPGIKTDHEYAAPRNEIEGKLAEIWAEVLGREALPGIDENFFEAGGHSLKAAVMTARIHKFFNVEVALGEIFQHPTIRAVARYITNANQKKYSAIEPVEKKEYYPLSSAQQRLYILQHLDPGSTVYNMPKAIQLRESISRGELEQVFRHLLQRHEVFRTSFETVDEKPVQRIHETVEFEIEYDRSLVNGQRSKVKGQGGQLSLVNCQGRGEVPSPSPLPLPSPSPSPSPIRVEKIIGNFIRPFDLTRAPLLRVGFFSFPGREGGAGASFLLIVDIHHIISDGTSVQLLVREFLGYTQGETFPGLRIQYKDYVGWQNQKAVKEKIKYQEEYWITEFSGEIPVLNLPNDGPRPVVQSFAGSNYCFVIEEAETAALKRLALGRGVTLFMVLVALFNLLLSKLSGQEDIVIGTPTAGRGHADLEGLIGMFVNTLALRNYPRGEKTFVDFLSEVKHRTLEAFENQDYPFEELVEKVAVERDAARNPLFDVMFSWQNLPETALTADKSGAYFYEEGVSRFDMTWIGAERGECLDFEIEYCTRLFGKETIGKFSEYFKKLAGAVSLEPGTRIAGLGIITEAEKQQVLFDFNDTGGEHPVNKTLHGLFAEQAGRTPDHIALFAREVKTQYTPLPGPISISYRELDEMTGHLARRLTGKGILPGVLVGVRFGRSVEMIVGILGILKAGGAYVPLNPQAPANRNKYLLEECDVRVLITGMSLDKLDNRWETVEIDTILSTLRREAGTFPPRENFPGKSKPGRSSAASLAYIIYTSGSTGKPKGVAVTHANVSPLLHWGYRHLGIGKGDRVIQNLAYYFDWSVWEIFIALTTGAGLYIAPEEILTDTGDVITFMNEKQVTVLHATPTQYAYFVDTGRRLERLKYLFLGAEALTPGMVEQSLGLVPGECRVFNMYGPTEATIISSVLEIQRGDRQKFQGQPYIPIGRAVGNTVLLVLDRYRGLCPIGVTGELYIGGDGVAGGYINNPELTAEKFIMPSATRGSFEKPPLDPVKLLFNYHSPLTTHHSPLTTHHSPLTTHHSPLTTHHSPLYKTGDLARWWRDGNIEFLGRIDHQVKIRGYRIELGEIENRLSGYPGIKKAVVQARAAANGEKYLCAYIVSDRGEIPAAQLREYLAGELPEYMIPAYFERLDEIPLSPTDKVDRQRLPEPRMRAGEMPTAPGNEIEKKLIEIWAEILGRDPQHVEHLRTAIGINAGFFEWGGHSLKAVVLMARIHRCFNVKITLSQVFKQPTVKGLAQYIKEAEEERYTALRAVEKKEYYPQSSPQKRLYILQQMDLESTVYHITQGIELEIRDDRIEMGRVFGELVRRHESMRTAFVTVDGEPVQRVLEEVPGVRVAGYKIPANAETPGREILKDFKRPFDLARPPLLRIAAIHLEGNRYILVMDLHHIICDGASLGIIMEEIRAMNEGKELPRLYIHYKEYTQWQTGKENRARVKSQEEYWEKEYQGEIPVLNLPTDYIRPAVQSFAGGTMGFEMGEEQSRGLKALALEHRVTLFMVLQAVFDILLSKLSGQEDIVIGTPTAGRRHVDVQRIVGMFVNTLALRNYPCGEKIFGEFLAEVKQRTLEAFENQDYPFEDLVEKVAVQRDAARNPLFDVMFSWQNLQAVAGTVTNTGTYSYEGGVSRFDMTWAGMERGNALAFEIEYCTKLFDRETIGRFSEYFKRLAAAVVAAPGARISGLEIISAAEKQRVLYDFNDTDAENPVGHTLYGIFAEQAGRTPDYIAVVGPQELAGVPQEGAVSYRGLKERIHFQAHRLKEKGVEADTIVGIMEEPTIEMMVGLLGILAAGGAYMPIDPGFPEERINYQLTDSAAAVLITGSRHFNCRLPIQKKLLNKSFTGSRGGFSKEPLVAEGIKSSPTASLAYVLYTSGTTGKPKGVMVEQASVLNILWALHRRYPFGEADAYLFKTAYVFDVSVSEIFGWYWGGGRQVILPGEARKDPTEILTAIARNRITHIDFVPAMYTVFAGQLSHRDLRQIATLKYIFLAGEELLPSAVKKFMAQAPQIPIENLYGPTEATIYATAYSLAGGSGTPKIPIGKPLPNVKVYILDRNDGPQPEGIPGELCIAGQGLARGYLNNPELTGEKFIRSDQSDQSDQSDRSDKSDRFYRTGDLSRWLLDGNIEFLGRIDRQVKIRGNRIELGEIENRLQDHDAVREAVVIVREEAGGDKYLCAYVVYEKGAGPAPGEEDLREYLTQKLPPYMIPTYFEPMEAFPVSPTGKIRRSALPAPGITVGVGYAAPRDHIEKKLAAIWAAVLAKGGQPARLLQDVIGIDDNFFTRGGHSLKATVMVSRIQEELGVQVPLQEVFKSPTIRKLSVIIKAAEAVRWTPIDLEEKKEYYPLSYNQERLRIIQQLDPAGTAYHMPGLIPLRGPIDAAIVKKTLAKLFARHGALRTGIKEVEIETYNQAVQFIRDQVEIPFEIIDISDLEGAGKRQKEAAVIQAINTAPFDLETPPLFRSALVKQEEGKSLLVYCLHHIITDGWSMEILAKEFGQIYGGFTAGEEAVLPDQEVRYIDFAAWHRRQMREPGVAAGARQYWQKIVKTGLPALKLPYYYNGDQEDKSGAGYRTVVPQNLKEKLQHLATANNTTLFILIYSLYNLLFAYLTGQTEIVTAVISAGRSHSSLYTIVGYFIESVIVKISLGLDQEMEELLTEVGQKVLEALKHQNYPLEEVLAELKVPYPGVSAAFNFLNMQDITTETELESLESYHSAEKPAAKFPLVLFVTEYKNGIEIDWNYRKTMFKPETIENIAEKYIELMEEAAE